MEMDWEELGLKVGLEIHQQLDTRKKLFCGCPTVLCEKEDAVFKFKRYLRAAKSELGEVDAAAIEEAKKRRAFVYYVYESTCLVESDEEPPGELNDEALDIALEVALLLHMKPVDEVHTMRKIVIDGSNTSGFQRTALVATDGWIESDEGTVRIDTLCVEEEAAQKIGEHDQHSDADMQEYSLDRLGIPLVEITTSPDIKTPSHAREVAERIGMILRSTRKVKRGIGTIRQDLNISISRGARVEIKGVQELRLIERIVENEVRRQLMLIEISEELRRRNARVERRIVELSHIFRDTSSNVIKRAGGKVFGACLRGFGGILGIEIQPERRFGAELADYARRYGVGIMHTDELPAYGISADEVRRVKEAFNASEDDCVVLIASDEIERVERAFDAVLNRAELAMRGVPEETRRAMPDGNTAYMRPLPGAARMYPETDVPPVSVDEERIERILRSLPETIEQKKERYKREYGLNEELARKIAASSSDLFEKLVKSCCRGGAVTPKLIARTLTDTLTELAREGVAVDAERIDFEGIFRMISENAFGKEAIPDILKFLSAHPDAGVDDAVNALGLRAMRLEDVERLVDEVVQSRIDFVRERGMSAAGPLMGVIMKDVRGKVDGKLVSDILRKKIASALVMEHEQGDGA